MGKKKTELSGNAVIYARYSSHNQRDVSIEQQFEACTKFAADNKLTIIGRYADRAVSGKTDNRPQFQKMMRDAHKGEFDYVIAWKSNRMGRNMLQAMVNESKLAELGIKCLYVEEDFDDTAAGRFALRNMMNVNQFYSENMAEDICRGLMDNAQQCKVNGRVPFGYKKGPDGKYAIDDEAAAIVREIYTRVKTGWSISEIMEDLNSRHVRTRDGNPWRFSSFEKMLENEQYTGVYKYSSVRIENGIPVIIEKELFDSVQAILRSKQRARGRQREHIKYLISGKCYCGLCGAPMTGMSAINTFGNRFEYYACNRHRYDHDCRKKSVSRDRLENAVLRVIKADLMSDAFTEWVVSGYAAAVAEIQADTKKRALQAELDDVTMRLSNILKAIEAGIFNESTQRRMEELSTARKDLEREIRMEEAANKLPTQDEVRFWLYELRSGNLEDREYLKKLIKVFVKAVYVYDDRLRILFHYGKDHDHIRDGSSSQEFAEGPPLSTSGVSRELFFTTSYFEVQIPF